MKVAHYKGRDRIFNRTVSAYLRGPYSHTELVLAVDGPWSMCASSSFQDNGVRSKWIKLDPARWDLQHVDGSVSTAQAWMQEHEGDTYDLLGLTGFAWRPITGEKHKWWCSEAVAAMLGYPDPWRFDPMVLWAALARYQYTGESSPRSS